jgi:competence protein ComEA
VPADAVVDLNNADATTLETLPGIGPAMAQRILTWREEHGGFRTVEDLLEVSGIGDARFAELRDRVRV